MGCWGGKEGRKRERESICMVCNMCSSEERPQRELRAQGVCECVSVCVCECVSVGV